MRVHLFDPQLCANDGHYVGYASAIPGELERRRTPYTVYSAASHQASMPVPFPTEPVFRRDMFDETGRDPITWAFENFMSLNAVFHQDLCTLDSGRFDSGDIAFFPNILQNQIDGIRQWILGLPAARRPTVVLKPSYLTHLMPYMLSRQNKDLTAVLFRFAIRRLVADHARTVICTDTEEIAATLGQIADVPIALVPIPLAIEDAVETRAPAERLRCTYLGHASALKGFHLLPEVVARLRQSRPAPRFLVQSYGDASFCTPIETALRALGDDAVTVVAGAVARQEYLSMLRGADIILMPYSQQFYGWASSGILVEALSLHKVVVVTEGTWAARQGARFNAGFKTFRDLNAAGVATSIEETLADFPRLSALARAAAPGWRAYHSPQNFVDQLLAAARARARESAPQE
jgi:glycosyltransferase involved in cell wall biosynthesis